MAIEKDVLDRLLAGRDPDEVFARGGLLDELKKALSERTLNAELDAHLEEERGQEAAAARSANRRDGPSSKTVLTGTSKVRLAIPRDRAGTFDPRLIAKHQRRFPDFDDKIVSMHARGMSVRAIRDHLEGLYGIDVSPDLISTVTDAVLEEVAEWQGRPLDACHRLVFFDAIRVTIRDEGFVRSEPSRRHRFEPDGERRLHRARHPPRWDARDPGSLDPADRGREVLVAGDGRAQDPRRLGHPDCRGGRAEGLPRGHHRRLSRHRRPDRRTHAFDRPSRPSSLDFISWKDRQAVVPALRAIHRAKDAEAGLAALDAFEAGPWGAKHPAVVPAWRRNWDRVIPFFAFPEAVRRIVYTTDAIEALNSKLRRAVRARGHFPSDEAATKGLNLVLNRAAADRKRPPREWVEARTQFAITFGERFRVS